jgi:hypothetical protein
MISSVILFLLFIITFVSSIVCFFIGYKLEALYILILSVLIFYINDQVDKTIAQQKIAIALTRYVKDLRNHSPEEGRD